MVIPPGKGQFFALMKTLPALLSAGLLCLSLVAQAQTMTWPVAGKSAGEDIIAKPQGYVGDEFNFDHLFIGGEEGDVILCPADGTILYLSVDYYESLDYMYGTGFTPGQSFDRNIEAADFGEGTDRRYYTGSITIRLADGSKIHISGLSGDRTFKTGQEISAGDVLGVIGYSYKAVKQRSIFVSISDRNNKPKDPMSPFGLESTFVEPKEMTRENPLPVEKAREDLDVLKEAFCELYPSLEKRMPEMEFRAFVDSLKLSVTEPVNPSTEFRAILQQILHSIPDSHHYLFPDPLPSGNEEVWSPGTYLMYCDDTVRVLLAQPGFKQLEGKVVTRIDGLPAKSYAERAEVFVSNYDGKVESLAKEQNVLLGRYERVLNLGAGEGSTQELEFSDGTTAVIPFFDRPRFRINDTYYRVARWLNQNASLDDDDVFETRELNDSTSYLALKTFEMLTGQVERIRDFLASCKSPNLIVDVRNNGGGHNEVLMQLLSYFADAPMDRQKGGYNRVNGKGPFPILKYSSNYSPEKEIFPEYEEREDGFYLLDTLETCSVVMPDPSVHYDGRVYVLTNAFSFSAAMLFPAVLVRNRRGVSVGRETGTTYHDMTALKFADIRLPNSLQTIRIPLVQLVFDTTVCDRLPEGRGLLPDYPLPLTYYEITCGADGQTDVMLEYALSLIAEGKYLSEKNPFEEFDRTFSLSSVLKIALFALIGVLLAASVIIFISLKRKGQKK